MSSTTSNICPGHKSETKGITAIAQPLKRIKIPHHTSFHVPVVIRGNANPATIAPIICPKPFHVKTDATSPVLTPQFSASDGKVGPVTDVKNP